VTPEVQKYIDDLERRLLVLEANYQRECAKRARAERDSEKHKRVTVQDQKTIERLQKKIVKLERDPVIQAFKDFRGDE